MSVVSILSGLPLLLLGWVWIFIWFVSAMSASETCLGCKANLKREDKATKQIQERKRRMENTEERNRIRRGFILQGFVTETAFLAYRQNVLHTIKQIHPVHCSQSLRQELLLCFYYSRDVHRFSDPQLATASSNLLTHPGKEAKASLTKIG